MRKIFTGSIIGIWVTIVTADGMLAIAADRFNFKVNPDRIVETHLVALLLTLMCLCFREFYDHE